MVPEKGKKYVAMVVDRHYIGPETFIFSCNHAVAGEIDPETGIFTDVKGNSYHPIACDESVKSEIPYAYNCVVELKKLKELYNETSIIDAYKDYEDKYKGYLYFVSKSNDGGYYLVTQTIEEWREKAADQIENNDVEVGSFQEDKDEIGSEYERLIIDIINNKYSDKELKRIRRELVEHQDWIDNSIETVDLQMEAMENHENFTEYVDKKKNNENPIPEEKEEEEKKEEPQEEKKENKKININEVYNNVTKVLIAQDKPARRVIAELARKEMNKKKKKEGILLTGQSGSGKTLLMRLIAEHTDRPFIKVDATQLTVPGYVGKDIEEVLWDLFIKCERDLEKAERAIIFFDEIDKKGSYKKSDVSGQGVLNVLLPFIEGSTYDACADIKNSGTKIKMDTSNMTVILGGAYSDVYKTLLEKNSVGFGGTIYDKPTYRKATTKDFVEKGGMTEEFMGRVTVIKLNDLDVDDIKRILLESEESQIKIQEEIFNALGTKITFTDGYVTKIAKQAIEKKTGARGLNEIIDESTWEAFDEVYSNEGIYEEVIFDEDAVDDSSNYQLVKKM